ncbi:MAG: SufE family protein [Bacteroidetes bacterium]|nr:SufE family protein [Bacteroidota bacterium]MBS1942723.1 SufE family protein [Bacteroidota bacterium]
MTLAQAQQEVVDEFAMLSDWQDRYEQLIEQGRDLPLIAPEHKVEDNLVRGCQSRVWLHAELQHAALSTAEGQNGSRNSGTIHFTADSDALITKGIVALLVRVYNDRSPQEILGASTEFIDRIGLREHLSPNRANGLSAMIDQMKRYALAYSSVK